MSFERNGWSVAKMRQTLTETDQRTINANYSRTVRAFRSSRQSCTGVPEWRLLQYDWDDLCVHMQGMLTQQMTCLGSLFSCQNQTKNIGSATPNLTVGLTGLAWFLLLTDIDDTNGSERLKLRAGAVSLTDHP